MISPGTIVDDKYEIKGVLGKGGFGAVYEATQKQFERQVAIKMLNTTLLQERDGRARFEREALTINALKHKNIVTVYGYGIWQQTPYMVMELLPGISLDLALSEQKPFAARRALKVMRQVFAGLSCAHAQGVVHRDLKPSNIMITEQPDGSEWIKIIDFGLAKLMPAFGASGQKLTETGVAPGTCHFMAPEQAMGGEVDQRADIYAAGCIAYLLLSGRLPFDGDDNITLMYQQIQCSPKPLTNRLNQEIPADALWTFLVNCLAKNRENRYSTAAEAIKDIDALLAGKTITALAANQLVPTQAGKKTPAKSWTVLSVVLICLLAFAAISFWRQAESAQESRLLSMWDSVATAPPKSASEAEELLHNIESESASDIGSRLKRLRDMNNYCIYIREQIDRHHNNQLMPQLTKLVKQAFTMRRELPGPTSAFSDMELLRCLGSIQFSDARPYLDVILAGEAPFKNERCLPRAKFQRALVYRCEGNLEAAARLYDEASRNFRSKDHDTNDNVPVIACSAQLVDVLLLCKRTRQAQAEADALMHFRGLDPSILTSAARVALANGNYRQALDYALLASDKESENEGGQQIAPVVIALNAALHLNNQAQVEACLSEIARGNLINDNWNDIGDYDVRQISGLVSEQTLKRIENQYKAHPQ